MNRLGNVVAHCFLIDLLVNLHSFVSCPYDELVHMHTWPIADAPFCHCCCLSDAAGIVTCDTAARRLFMRKV